MSPDAAVAGILVGPPGPRAPAAPAGHQHDEEHEGGPGHQAVRGRDEVTASGMAVNQGLASNAEKSDNGLNLIRDGADILQKLLQLK